jgi:hypothetical protein
LIKIDTSAFREWLSQARAKLPVNNARALSRVAREAAVHAKRSSRYQSHTYALRKSIRGELRSPYHSRTIADAKHAGWVENGNGPRGSRIYPRRAEAPRRAKVLRFVLNGVVHYRKWVYAATPRPYMADARHAALPLFTRLVNEAAALSFR